VPRQDTEPATDPPPPDVTESSNMSRGIKAARRGTRGARSEAEFVGCGLSDVGDLHFQAQSEGRKICGSAVEFRDSKQSLNAEKNIDLLAPN